MYVQCIFIVVFLVSLSCALKRVSGTKPDLIMLSHVMMSVVHLEKINIILHFKFFDPLPLFHFPVLPFRTPLSLSFLCWFALLPNLQHHLAILRLSCNVSQICSIESISSANLKLFYFDCLTGGSDLLSRPLKKARDQDLGHQVSRLRPRPWPPGLKTKTLATRSRDQDQDLRH